MKNVHGLILAVWCSAVFTFSEIQPADAAEFFCTSGDVDCVIAAINEGNAMPGEHVINLEPGKYVLQTVNNGFICENGTAPVCTGPNGLPLIMNSVRIQATAEDLPTIIERDPNASQFRIFEVSQLGKLTLDGVTVQRGLTLSGGAAIRNRGVTSLEDSVIRDSDTEFDGAIDNLDTLRVIRSIIADNNGGHMGGGIKNLGNALVENSTIARNSSADGGGIFNLGSLIVKNSAIISNVTDAVQPGGGILNAGGSLEIVNSTIANNRAGLSGGGGGIFNGVGFDGLPGRVSITNSTIRENRTFPFSSQFQRGAAGIANDGGTVLIQNTIVAGNIPGPLAEVGPECSGTITSLGNNLVGDPSGCDIKFQPSDLVGDPGLGPLVESGEDDSPGNAFYPVLAGSVLINRANPVACPKKDQLGGPRVGTCDIGAVEFYPLVNDLVAMTNVSTTFDPTPVPGGPAGTFRITAALTNTSTQPIGHRFAEVAELTGGNLLLNADGGAGGVGARVTPVSSTPFLPGATETFEFIIGLQTQEPFTFLVNVLGDPQILNESVTMRRSSGL